MLDDEFVQELPPSVPPVNVEPELKSSEVSEIPEQPVSEPPPSSGGAPSLHELTGPAHIEPPVSRRDDFELAFGPTDALFQPPTIDVSDLTSPSAGEEPAPPARRGAATLPQFDVSALERPPASSPVSSLSPTSDSAPPSSVTPLEGRKRKRKKVVAPADKNRGRPSEAPASRAGSVIWGAIALLGLVGGGVWFLRDRATTSAPEPAAAPPPPAAEPVAAPAPPPPEPAPEPEPTAPEPAPPATPQAKTAPAAEAKQPRSNDAPAARTASEEQAPKPAPTEQSKPAEPQAPPASTAETPEVTAPFDKAAAIAALSSAAAEASSCRKPGDPSGVANVTITFAPSGRVTTANVSGPPFAGTPTGGCIAATLRRARVPPFAGDHVTVSKSVVVQ